MPSVAKSAKRTGGNYLPVARGAEIGLERMRTLYLTVLRMRDLSYDLQDKGKAFTPAPAEWDAVMDEIRLAADAIRLGLKGRMPVGEKKS